MNGARKAGLLAFLAAAAAGVALLGVGGCTTTGDDWPPGSKHKVVVSFAPLFSFVKSVAGDDVAVRQVLTTRGPHDYNPSPHDVLPLRKADVFFVSGLGLDEKWSHDMANTAGNPRLKVVELAEEGIEEKQLIRAEEGHADEAGHHHHGAFDPHVWLGIPEAVLMVKQVAKELKALDPEHAAAFDQRAGEYVQRLEDLRAHGEKALAGDKEERRLVTTHESLGYFARMFGLEVVGHIQPRAGHGIDPKELSELVKACQEKKVRVIATEPMLRRSKLSAIAA